MDALLCIKVYTLICDIFIHYRIQIYVSEGTMFSGEESTFFKEDDKICNN